MMTIDNSSSEFFGELYKNYKALMISQALRYTKDVTVAEDVVQDALLKLLNKYFVLADLGRYALTAYIVYTIRSIAINRYKKISKEEQYMVMCSEEEISPSAEDLLMSGLFSEPLASVWPRLSEDDRCLLERKYIEELTTSELSAIYDCTPENIRVMLFRARNRTKKLLNEFKEEVII